MRQAVHFNQIFITERITPSKNRQKKSAISRNISNNEACIFNTFHDVKKKTYEEEWRAAITRILKSDWRAIYLFFCQSVRSVFNNGFSCARLDRDMRGRKRVLRPLRVHFRNYLPSSCGRAVFSLCSARAPIGVAASDIAPLRPNCFCYLAVCAAARPKPSRVFPASIKSTRRVMWYSRFSILGSWD